LIKESGISIIVDNLFGTSREYLDYILSENGIEAMSIHNYPYSAFGGVISSCNRTNLKDLAGMVVEQKAHLGLSTDIDGDRFGIIDSRGRYLCSNVIMPPLIEYLIKVRKMKGGIVKSISTTQNIRAVAEYYSREIISTPVGFKSLADKLETGDAFIAVESSNGASLNGTIKSKDGILFSLLITEMLAYYKLDMDKILESFYKRFPRLYSHEIGIQKSEHKEERYKKLLSEAPPRFVCQGKELDLKEIDYTDGIKFRFENCWLLIRESGTSDILRIYAESDSIRTTRALIKMGHSFLE